MVGLFILYSNLVSEAPCSFLPFLPAPEHCRSWGSKVLARRLPGAGYGLLVWKWSWAMLGTSAHPNLPKASAASHSFILGLTATGCSRRALTWIQLIADPIDAQLHKLIDDCHAISVVHLLHHIPGSIPSLLITSTTGFSFQVNIIKRIYLAHFAHKGRLLNGSFYLLCIPGQ